MEPADAQVMERINAFAFDAPGATKTFAVRLMEENGWSESFTHRVIEEYRRFIFIGVRTNHGVSPSDAVDQVWHLHLLYTKRYWEDFCKGVLGRPFHHEPATGVEGEGAKLGDQYVHTLASYRKFFGEPPVDIWPEADAKYPQPKHRRINLSETCVINSKTLKMLLIIGAAFIIAILILLVIFSEK